MRARQTRRALLALALAASGAACSLVVSPADYLGEGAAPGPQDGGGPPDAWTGPVVDGEALNAPFWLMGGDRDPIGPASGATATNDILVTRVLPSGALEAPTPTVGLPIRGSASGARIGDAVFLNAFGSERGETSRRMLLRGTLGPDAHVTQWVINSVPAPPLLDGVIVLVGRHLYSFGATEQSTVDGGTVSTPNQDVYAAPFGTETGVVQAWKKVASGDALEERRSTSVITTGGFVYLFSGVSGSEISNTVEFGPIDGEAGTVGPFTKTTPVTIDGNPHRALSPALRVHGDYLYLAGGRGTTSSSWTALRQVVFAKINADGSLGAWQRASDLPVGLQGFAFYGEGERLFTIGGRLSNDARTDAIYANRVKSDGTLEVEWSSEGMPKLPTPATGFGLLRLY